MYGCHGVQFWRDHGPENLPRHGHEASRSFTRMSIEHSLQQHMHWHTGLWMFNQRVYNQRWLHDSLLPKKRPGWCEQHNVGSWPKSTTNWLIQEDYWQRPSSLDGKLSPIFWLKRFLFANHEPWGMITNQAMAKMMKFPSWWAIINHESLTTINYYACWRVRLQTSGY